MLRRIVQDKDGWVIEETLSKEGTPSRSYYFKNQLGLRLELDGPIAKRLAGLTLLEKDLRTILSWLDALLGLLCELGNEEQLSAPSFMPTGSDATPKITVARAIFVAIVTTYGKLFTTAEGRGTSLNRRDSIPTDHHEVHEYLMHMRNTFAAHSGLDSFESCGIVLAVDYSRRNRTAPRIFTELHQPTTISVPDLRKVRALIEVLHRDVNTKQNRATTAAYKNAAKRFDSKTLYMLRKGAPGTFLRADKGSHL